MPVKYARVKRASASASTGGTAFCALRRATHDRQEPRRLQLKAASLSWPYSLARAATQGSGAPAEPGRRLVLLSLSTGPNECQRLEAQYQHHVRPRLKSPQTSDP